MEGSRLLPEGARRHSWSASTTKGGLAALRLPGQAPRKRRLHLPRLQRHQRGSEGRGRSTSWQRTFELNDDSVVVIIGSGAGGGTLGNELAQKGIKVVMLEAGGRLRDRGLRQRRVGELRAALLARQAHHLGHLAGGEGLPEPAGLDRARRSAAPTTHWAGASLRFQEHEFKAKTTYGDIAGANLLDWPIDARRAGALLRQGRGQDGRDPHQRHRRACRATTTSRCSRPAPRSSATRRSIPATWRSTASRATTGSPASRSASASRAASPGAKWSTLYTEIPAGDGHRQSRAAAGAHGAADPARRRRQGHRRASMPTRTASSSVQKARVVAVAGNSIESPRLLLNSASAKFPDGLANSSGQVGRNYMRHMTGSVYAIFDKPVHMYRGTTMAGIIQDEARHDPSAASSAATSWRRCRSACRSWRRSSTPAPGAASSPRRWTATTTWPACGSSARTCRRRRNRRHAARRPRRTSTACRSPNVHFDDHPNDIAMRNHAYRAGRGGLRGGRARRGPSRRRPIPRPTISAPTG